MVRGATTYGTAEAAKKLGVSKPTLLRWFAQKRISEVRRDHNNWRVFTERDLQRIRSEVMGNGGSRAAG
jgi:excisionase family DNA binding protein